MNIEAPFLPYFITPRIIYSTCLSKISTDKSSQAVPTYITWWNSSAKLHLPVTVTPLTHHAFCSTDRIYANQESPTLDAKCVQTILFDALIWLSGGQVPLAASFRYYNSKNLVFADDSMFYVHAKVSMSIVLHSALYWLTNHRFQNLRKVLWSATHPQEDYDLLGGVVFVSRTVCGNFILFY